MATGYTAGVQSGEIADFPTFALLCARAFGALIEMRDDPMNAEIPPAFAPSDYHVKALREAEERLASLRSMSTVDAQAAADADYAEQAASHGRRERERQERRGRYEAMLAQVNAWTPPTPDHVEMQTFMRKQLTDSIYFDCGDSAYDQAPQRQDGAAWLAAAIARATRDVEYHRAEHAKEVERVNSRNAWVRALRESLAVAS